MNAFVINQAAPADATVIAGMVQQLLEEIMSTTGGAQFNVDPAAITRRCAQFISDGIYTVLLAVENGGTAPIGFISLTATHSLYAGGGFGIIPELYVQPPFRSAGVGQLLLEAAKAHGRSVGWQRLEVTTPPLPMFDRTLAFYQDNGFEVAGGRKMRVLL